MGREFSWGQTRVSYLSLDEQLADFSERRHISAGRPIPNEDYFEWITLPEAVVEAQASFTLVELGAGWGKWLVNGVAALRAHGPLPYHIVGVESEPTHFKRSSSTSRTMPSMLDGRHLSTRPLRATTVTSGSTSAHQQTVRTIRYRKARHSGLNPSRAVRPVRGGVGYEAHRTEPLHAYAPLAFRRCSRPSITSP